MWHLASTPDDRNALVAEPELIPTAVEEILRAYAPVTMARLVSEDIRVRRARYARPTTGCCCLPAANRDPEPSTGPMRWSSTGQEPARRVRARHPPLRRLEPGPHGDAGRAEAWLERFTEFTLADPDAVRWAAGQVRGPRSLPVRINGLRVVSGNHGQSNDFHSRPARSRLQPAGVSA